jgi:uncharacterized protein with NAD-binding domain and iron-sulfur cluster
LKKKKIAILGGGIASLTTALEITQRPDWQESYDLTVYQLGWRLGGKGASSRNPDASDRIEEHGLHIWLGFYENAFAMIRRCYEELNEKRAAGFSRWDDAFKPHRFITVEENINGLWSHWPVTFPANDSLPGDGRALPTIWDYLSMTVQWIEDAIRSMGNPPQAQTHSLRRQSKPPWWDVVESKVISDGMAAGCSLGSSLIQMALARVRSLPPDPTTHGALDHQAIHWILQELSVWLHSFVAHLCEDTDFRRTWIAIDLFTAAARGLIADGLIYNGFDVIDGYDFRSWLRKHGASDMTSESAWLRGGYDLAFSFVGGDTDSPNIAAGAGLRAMLRMVFAYKGAPLWKMQAGMGETVFTSIYQVLKARGVKFKFFHKVVNLKLSEDKTHIAEIKIARQATLNDGREYAPLVRIAGFDCWPIRPLYEQLQEGDKLKAGNYNLESFWTDWSDIDTVSLKAGEEFDVVVLGIPIGCFPLICRELVAASDRWKAMVSKVLTIQTQGFQVWLKPSLTDAGWELESPILGAYVEPIDTWADMSQLLKVENWPPSNAPKQLAYFCGVMKDAPNIPGPEAHDFPAQEYQRVKATAVDYLKTKLSYLLPRTLDPNTGSFNWNLLVAADGTAGPMRFDSQYWRPNIDPSERYVLAVAGSTQFRLRTDESGFTNLILTGDWIRNGLNTSGCIEAAVISGRQAGRAITEGSYKIIGESDFI